MTRTRAIQALLLGTVLAAGLAPALAQPAFAKKEKTAESGQTVRPEVGKPLQAAQDLVKAKKYKEAQAKLKEADAVASKTPYETFVLEETRGFILMNTGNPGGAAAAFEAVLASGQLSAADAQKRTQAIAQLHYQAKDYAKAAVWTERYLKLAPSDAQMRTLLVQAQYLNGDFAAAGTSLTAAIAAAEKAGQPVPEDQLQLLASIAVKQKDDAGYLAALEKLVRHHPKPDYWQDLIIRTQKKPGFNRDRLTLDVYRLMLATGVMRDAGDYVEMAQLSLEATLPGEARAVLAKGVAAGLVGQGAEADRHKRLIAMAEQQSAADVKSLAATEKEVEAAGTGGPAVRLGEAFASHGQYDKAIQWIAKGIQKGGLKQPELAQLHLGLAYLHAGQGEAAVKTLAGIKAADGTSDIARLWTLTSAPPRS